jgi:hypothetical protein
MVPAPEAGEIAREHQTMDHDCNCDWDRRMAAERAWILSHPEAIQAVLPLLEREWPECCAAVRAMLSGG